MIRMAQVSSGLKSKTGAIRSRLDEPSCLTAGISSPLSPIAFRKILFFWQSQAPLPHHQITNLPLASALVRSIQCQLLQHNNEPGRFSNRQFVQNRTAPGALTLPVWYHGIK
jgi:hypothetical protein